MFWIIERWEKETFSPEIGEEIEIIKNTEKIASRKEGILIAERWKDIAGTIRVTLHHCGHDEVPFKPCTREGV